MIMATAIIIITMYLINDVSEYTTTSSTTTTYVNF